MTAASCEPVLAGGVSWLGAFLELDLAAGETAWLRRSSLVHAEGPFRLTTEKIATRGLSLIGFFSGQVRWANRYDAEGPGLRLVATRDHQGTVVRLDVTPDSPVHISPGLYLGHRGRLSFETRRVAQREFWTLTRVEGAGSVYIKLFGQALLRPLNRTASIVDANYVAAVTGPFEAHGKVFKASEVIRSGELENVKMTGAGLIVFQSVNPEELGQQTSPGGAIAGLIRGVLPF